MVPLVAYCNCGAAILGRVQRRVVEGKVLAVQIIVARIALAARCERQDLQRSKKRQALLRLGLPS